MSASDLIEQLSRGATDWMDARVPELLRELRTGCRRSELQCLLQHGALSSARLSTIDAERALELADVLAELSCMELAFAVSSTPQLVADPRVAARRARLAMQLHNYRAAVAASEIAISALLQPGLSVDEFLRRCSAGAPAEGMLRFERHVLAERAHLSERLAVRWEALHRAGMTREAQRMQWMCQRYFPERASVWATAGNHALDADDVDLAERYFQHCLQLDPAWTAALAGMAIVCERRKDWSSALPYRRRVLELEQALTRSDAASLQRRIRYAAALARVGRWAEAEPLFRAAVSVGAFVQLAAERPVLLRVFSQELYAPALIAEMLHSLPPGAATDAAVTLAQHEACLLARLADTLCAGSRWELALCAYLAGELERAYELFDRMEDERPQDLAVHYLLWRCARAIGHEQTQSIREFAVRAARHMWPQLRAAGPEGERSHQLQFALAILPELGSIPGELRAQLPEGATELASELCNGPRVLRAQRPGGTTERASELCNGPGVLRAPRPEGTMELASELCSGPGVLRAQRPERTLELASEQCIVPGVVRAPLPEGTLELAPLEAATGIQLERIVAFRTAQEAAGSSPLAAAAASTHALAAAAAASR